MLESSQCIGGDTLGAMHIKRSIMTRVKCLIEMFKVSKSENFGNFGPLIDYGTYWINFIILSVVSENNRYSKKLYKNWSKFISFDMRKKITHLVLLESPQCIGVHTLAS